MAGIRIGGDAQFAALREFLLSARYNPGEIAARTGRKPDEYLRIIPGSLGAAPPADALDFLIRLLLAGEALEAGVIEASLPLEARRAIDSLGLLAPFGDDAPAAAAERRFYAPVALYPIGDVWVISDRWAHPDLSAMSREDAVYPVTANTVRFLATLPQSPCLRLLELCAGTGVAAFLGARHFAGHAWALDITGRATEFAEFGRRLNGLDNCTALEGDLYDPVRGLTFDRIVAHPPYVPVLRKKNIYSDAGADGQEVTRRIVEDAPRFLEPGGRLYATTTGLDRTGEPLEQCLRRWLGEEASSEFDVAVFAQRYQSPREVAFQLAVRASGGQPLVDLWVEQFESLEIDSFVHCSFVLQRRVAARPTFTLRRHASPQLASGEIEALLAWETRAVQPGFAREFLETSPRVAARTRLEVAHVFKDGEVRPTTCTLRLEAPFTVDCAIEPWTIYVLSRADGSRTVAQLFAEARAQKLLPSAATVEEFGELLLMLVSGGFLEVPGA